MLKPGDEVICSADMDEDDGEQHMYVTDEPGDKPIRFTGVQSHPPYGEVPLIWCYRHIKWEEESRRDVDDRAR